MYVCTLLVTCSLFPAAAEQTASRAESLANLSRVKIGNFGRINANYYRGAQPDNDDYAALAAAGVKALVDLTDDDGDADEEAMVKATGLKYFRIPMTTHVAPTPAQVAEFLRIVTDPESLPVYVHCVGGRHRTGVMTAVYRMTQDGWSADRAFKEMKQYKFGADFLHPQFKEFVYSYRVNAAPVAGGQPRS